MKKITVLDGAVGTCLWEKADRHGFPKDPVWKYNIDHPEIVKELAEEYLEAGAQIIQANTFGANRLAVSRFPGYDTKEVVRAGVRIVKEVTRGTDVKCSLDIGPLTMLLEPYGDLEEDECREIFEEMIDAGMEEGPDMIFLETFMDVEMMRIAAEAAKRYEIPVVCSMTFEKVGKTMFGNSVEDVIETLSPLHVDALGLNCSLGPDLAVPVIREFAEKTALPLVFKPNAGKPIMNETGAQGFDYSAETFAKELVPAFAYASYIGGCCGSDPSYIREIRKQLNAFQDVAE